MKSIRMRAATPHGWHFPLLLATIMLVPAMAGCSAQSSGVDALAPKAAVKAAAVRAESVKPSPLALALSLTGSVEAGRIAQLASPAEGPVMGVRVREGDTVARGQVLLSLGRSDGATSLVDSLREDLIKEEDNLARTRRLVESGALPAEQLDGATANVARVRAQLAKARESSRDYVIAAPWAGVVSRVKVRDGDFVGPRAPLAEIYDPASLVVRLTVPEVAAAGVAVGMKAGVELDAYPKRLLSGNVTRLYPYLDSRTHSRIAEIVLVAPPPLLPGMFARVNLVRETLAGAITVPSFSLVPVPGGGSAVFVVRDGKAARQKVQTGIEIDGRTLVTAGLEEGDRVIVAGHEALKDGASVQVMDGDAKKSGGAEKSGGSEKAAAVEGIGRS